MNLPNKITTFRMVAVIIVDFLLLFPWRNVGVFTNPLFTNGPTLDFLLAFIIFVIASFSDYLDGHIARKYNLVTTYGKFMDPIADKLLVNTVLIICAINPLSQKFIPAVVVVIMISRDLLVDALRLIASSKGMVLAANMWGKAKTVSQMVALSFVLLLGWPFSMFDSSWVVTITQGLCWIAALTSLISGILYFTKNLKVFKD